MKWRKTTYSEYIGPQTGVSPIEQVGNDYTAVQRAYLVNWDERWQAYQDFLGYSYARAGSGGHSYVSRVTPHPYGGDVDQQSFINPDNNFTYLYASQVERCEGIGSFPYNVDPANNAGPPEQTLIVDSIAGGMANLNQARMMLRYESLDYEVLDDSDMVHYGYVDSFGNPDESTLQRYVIPELHLAPQYLQMPRGYLSWVLPGASGPQIPDGVGYIEVPWDVGLTWVDVPPLCAPFQFYNPGLLGVPGAADNSLGTVNCSAFAGFDAGTLLFVGADVHRIRGAFGNRLLNIKYRFLRVFHGYGLDAAGNTVAFGHNYLPFLATGGNVPVLTFIEASTDPKTARPENGVPISGFHAFNSSEFRYLFRAP